MNINFDFSGKNFVIVGASSGIGRQSAIELANCGANILAIGRNIDRLNELQKNNPEKIFTISQDVTKTNAENWNEIFEKFKNNCGKIDGGIYTAGIWGLTPLNGFDMDFARKIFEINFWGAINFIQTATKKMFSNKNSAYILMSSVAADFPSKSLFAYSAAKAALQAATKSFAKEIIRNGHRINTISPAMVKTEMMNNEMASMADEMISRHLLGLCDAEDIVGMILFLLSDRAEKITGQNFTIDGGYLSGSYI